MPFTYRDEVRELNERTRQETGGSFVQLSPGFTHYELGNPQAPQTAVLLHGFSVPSFIFDPTFAFLTQAGYRVLRFDLFGRGFSDRPATHYNMELFVGQLTDLLDALGLTGPVSLIGLSMGGPIAAAFTARHPERVSRLALIAPTGAQRLFLGRVARLLTRPGWGEALAGVILNRRMIQALARSPLDREHIGEFGPRYLRQMEYRGFKQALLSTVRNHMLGPFLEVYRQVGQLHKSVLLLWGRNDRAVPLRHSEILRRAMPGAELHIVERAGHIPHYERPEEVNAILRSFLERDAPHTFGHLLREKPVQ